jgi:RNA polymerase sigma-70 factor (ECF subfamily)
LPGDEGYDAYSRFEEAVWKGLPGFRWESSLRAWAYRIAWRAAARIARDGYRRRREPLPPASALGAEPASASTLGRHVALERLRGELSPDERTLLVLRLDRDLEWDEVSTVLAGDGDEVSAAALRKRFERLKAKLARLARERGLLPDRHPPQKLSPSAVG